MRSVLLACLVVLLAAPARAGEDEAALRRLAEGFVGAVARGDPEAAMALWSADARGREEVAASVAAACENAALRPPGAVALAELVVSGDAAEATLRFEGHLGREDEFDDEPATIWRVSFRREAAGWRWWAREHAALPLARALAAARDAGERARLLERNRELVTLRLVSTLTSAGNEELGAGNPAAAMRALDAACEAAALSGNDASIALALLTRGKALLRSGGSRQAVEDLEKARERAILCGSAHLEAGVRSNLGLALMEEGRGEEAEAEILGSLVLAEDGGFEDLRATFENNMGLVRDRSGDIAGALRWYRASLARARGLGREDLSAQPLNNIGTILWGQGDYGGALEVYAEARDIAGRMDDATLALRLSNNMGLVYLDARDHERALKEFEASRALAVRMESPHDAAVALNHAALARLALGKAADAARDLEAGLALAGDDPALARTIRNNLGFARREAGDVEGALRLYEASLEGARGQERIVPLCNAGEVLYRRGDASGALRSFSEALAIAQATGATGDLFLCYHGVGLALEAAGELEAALANYGLAEACIERSRGTLQADALRQSYLAGHTAVYDHAADALLALGRKAEAFAAAERKKARVLVDALASGGMRVTKAMTGEERAEEARRERDAAAIARELEAAVRTDERRALRARLAEARGGLEELRERMYLSHPDLRTLRARFPPATIEELDRALFSGDPRACVLSYAVIGSEAVLFLLRRGPEPLLVRTVAEDVPALRARARELWSGCAVAKGENRAAARALYALLVAPVEKEIADASHVVVVPDGILHGIPFHALEDGSGRRLIERWPVSYAPSVTALARMAEVADRRRAEGAADLDPMLAIGAPRMPRGFVNLPNAGKEAAGIAGAFGATAVLGPEATESRAKRDLCRARRIHLATHGKLDEASPMYSFVVLGADEENDGYLHAREIADLDLRAELAVLSACETARGRQVEGEGLVGLAWALLVAGVPSTVVSQWQVADEATGLLMTAFYENLGKGGTKAEALRQAQIRLLRDGTHGHPYYWAPFVVVGDWR